MNIVVLRGRLSRDPEVKTTASGMTISRFSVAVDRIAKKAKKKKPTLFPALRFLIPRKQSRNIALRGRK